MLASMQKHMQSRDAQIDSISAHNKIMDNQIAQLSSTLETRQQGVLPLQPVQPIDHANAITLRSGSHYDGPPMPKDDEPVLTKIANPDSFIPNDLVTGPGTTSKKVTTQDKSGDVQKPVIKLPFPSRQLKTKLDKQFGKFLEVVKNLQVTVPFTELITQVPAYAKFMKDILTRKRAFNEVETVAFTEECSALLQNKSPPNLKDTSSFSIPCHIGNVFIDKALCDLGASVSVMPSSVCSKLNMGDLKVTNITLKMANRSVKYPLGILEDVPIRVGKFFVPIDFVVLYMAEDTQIPIILGRPFLQIVGAIIDIAYHRSLQGVPWRKNFVVILLQVMLELHPVIISTALDDLQTSQLLEVLRTHNRAIGYKIDDLKGISPDFEGVVLGHIVSDKGIQVDKAKISVIEKLPPPVNVKGVKSFLGHAGFYCRFIKDFSKIAKSLT
ncbi:uncharacterized protein LOC110685255 [Chenopodium quinoa]|uniref:uncharacterized protein LOC110685255 n=1 Tax=Chenopodium quinoa TaxID=63459 RepID=UPI000B78F95B|nr:uncharacterized protein LOC110685255 [Chenopodium quinoa]